MRRDRTLLILGSVAALALLLAGGLWLSRGPRDPFADCRNAITAGETSRLGAAFSLIDQNGQRVSDRQVLAKPALLYFGYTYCPDVCPLDAARNAEAAAILDRRGLELTPVFVTVDPGRDTPEALRAFTTALHPRMIGLTGSVAETDAVARAWKNYYRLGKADADGNYPVDHMTNTYLVLPGAGTVASFDRDMPAPELADRATCFIDTAARSMI